MRNIQIVIIACLNLILSSCFSVDENEMVETDAVDSTFWSVKPTLGVSFESLALTNDRVMIFGVRSSSNYYLYNYDRCGRQLNLVDIDSVLNNQNAGDLSTCTINEDVFVFFRYFYGLILNSKSDVAKPITLESDQNTSYEEINSVKEGGEGCIIETHIGYSEIYHGEEHFMTGRKLIRINQLGESRWNKRIYSSAFSCIGTGLKSLIYSSSKLTCLNKDGEKDWEREYDGVRDLVMLENGNVLIIKEDEIECITETNEIKWSTTGRFYDKFDALQPNGFVEHTYRDEKIHLAKYDSDGTVDFEVEVDGPKYKTIKLINDSTLAVLSSNKFEIVKIPN